MSILRLAVVGVGAYESSRAREYLAAITKLTELYELCAICDSSTRSLEEAGARFGVSARYTDFEKMLEVEKPDVVCVLVPTDGQTVLALTAAQHGCHIITEIPYALTIALGDAIGRACEENGVIWEVAENLWLRPHERLKQKIVSDGLLGKVTHARAFYTHGSYHVFNAMRMILGNEPVRVQGYAKVVEVPPYKNFGDELETTRWSESGTIEFEDGTMCLYEMPATPSPRTSLWEVEGLNGYLSGSELVLYRDGGQVSYPFRETYEESDGRRILASVGVDTDPPAVWDNPFKKLGISDGDEIAKTSILFSLHRAVTTGQKLGYGPYNARRDMELWIALRDSAAHNNIWVDLPLAGTTDLESSILSEYTRRYGGDPVMDRARVLKASFNRLSAMWTVAGWL